MSDRGSQALALLEELVDTEPCRFDHHGYCQEHMWFDTTTPCIQRRAKELLEAGTSNTIDTSNENWERLGEGARILDRAYWRLYEHSYMALGDRQAVNILNTLQQMVKYEQQLISNLNSITQK